MSAWQRFRAKATGEPFFAEPAAPSKPVEIFDDPIRDYVDNSMLASSTLRGQSGAVIQIDTGKHVNVVALCAALCALSVAVSLWAYSVARDAATESRLTQYYLMDPHSRTPEELAAWAKFNHEREHKLKE